MKHRLSSLSPSPAFKLRRIDQGSSTTGRESNSVCSLLDLSAQVVAESLPFEYVEKTLVHVPEPVQEKIIYHSFPRKDSDIYTYASFHSKSDKGRDKIPYYEGLEYFQNDCVENVIQIGFHLTGSVKQPPCVSSDLERRKFEVSITFDRCKIISVCCDCGNKGLSWCPHVVALALYRIRQPHMVDYRSPISDALVRMDRSQLQKFAQYLIASHPNKVLPSAQQLADELLQPESSINKTSGAPDPTAGASVEDVAAWYLDEAGVREQLRTELANLANSGSAFGPSITGFTGPGSSVSGTNTLRPAAGGGRSTPIVASVANTHSVGGGLPPPSSVVSGGTNNSAVPGLVTRSSSDLGRFDVSGSAALAPDADTAQSNETIPHPSMQTENGVNWLLRYRRLMLNQTLLGGSVSCPLLVQSGGPLSSLHLDVTSDTASTTHWFTPETGPLMSPVSSDMLTCGSSSWHHGSGAQIVAMFAKVRELLAKRDSNGPRLLSLITEELLRCPKLPLLKARRTHRTTDLPGRMSMPGLTRSLSAQQLSPNPPAESNLGTNSFSHTSSSTISSSQLPTWTTRLWEEVCVLWTCVVLSPDCSAEGRRQWRNRLLSWLRAHRCPRDEAYAVPGHYFASVRDQSELEEDINTINSQNSSSTPQTQSSGRANSRRASIFQLPLEASFLSWNDDCLRRIVGLESMKKCGGSGDLNMTFDSPLSRIPPNPIDTDETCTMTADLFRRPSSNTPRRGPAGSGRPQTPRDCQCPYCEQTSQLNEPFPLLCLRVAALRANGYQTQALRLAVFISQRLLRGFKSKATSANNSLVSCLMRTNSCRSQAFWNGSHNTEASVRRSLFAGNSTGSRVPTMNVYASAPPPPYNSASRYTPTANMLSPSSTISSLQKYHASGGRLPSPRPSSISPPVSVAGIPRPGSRRHVLSPGPNSNPMSSTSVNRTSLGVCPGPPTSVYKPIPLPHPSVPPIPPPSPYAPHSPSCASSFPHMIHAYPNAPSPSVPQPPPPPPPFHSHYSHYHYPYQFSQSNPSTYAFGAANFLPNGGRQLTSPKLLGRPNLYHSSAHRPLSSANMNNHNVNGSNTLPYTSVPSSVYVPEFGMDSLPMQSTASSSPVCPSHTTDSAWIGLPGRPIICLVECLLDAAAMVVELGNQHERQPRLRNQYFADSSLCDQLESASFYLRLSVKVSLVALFQQRRLSGSINRLLSCQAQETRLLAWLSTMPKDTVTLMAVCETMAHLLGPPALSRLMPRAEPTHSLSLFVGGHVLPSPAWWWWWWSSLGPITHPDSYPVHGITHFVLDYILEAKSQNPLSLIHNFWSSTQSSTLPTACLTPGSASPSACPGVTMSTPSAIRVDDLLFAMVTRAMRFSVLEPMSDSMGLVPVHSRSSAMHSNYPHTPPPSPFHHIYQSYHHHHHYPSPQGTSIPFISRPTERSLYPNRYWVSDPGTADVESALAVNTDITELAAMDPTTSSSRAATPDSHSVPGSTVPSTGFHYPSVNPSQLRAAELDRWPASSNVTIPYPPFPSAFASAVQACIKLLDIPYTQSASCMPIPPVLSSPACAALRVPSSPITCMFDVNPLVSMHQSTVPLASQQPPTLSQQQQQPPIPSSFPQIGTIFTHSNTPVRRCLEGMELQQTHLAVALVRLSKSSLLRLDQIVQIFDRHIHSAVSLLAISQQIFAEAVGLDSMLNGVRKYDSMPLFSSGLFAGFAPEVCRLGSTAPSTSSITAGAYSPDRINLICTAYHLALLVVLRTLTRTVHWRRREMLAWAVSTAIHVGPSACLYLITNWSMYVSPREAVNWLAPALIAVIGKSESPLPGLINHHHLPSGGKGANLNVGKSTGLNGVMGPPHSTESVICAEADTSSSAAAAAALLFGLNPAEGPTSVEHHHHHPHGQVPGLSDELPPAAAAPAMSSGQNGWSNNSWYGFQTTSFASRHHTNSITIAAQMLGSAVPYSSSAREHILVAVRHMALQAAAKDPVNCALPALTLAERNASAFDTVYRLVLHSAESGGLGPAQLFSLARYMDSRGWAWRAFPFALHATRLFVLSTMQDSHPVATDVLWACSLAHRLGPGALQELLQHVIRNIHCPTLLTEILHRCRIAPSGVLVPSQTGSINVSSPMDGTTTVVGRNLGSATFNSATLYHPLNNNGPPSSTSSVTASVCPSAPPGMSHAKLLSLDRPPLKALLDATINAFVTATHTRLANISPRQYAEFVDFLARARDTFQLLRPDGPAQFRSLVECLRQTYRGKRKLVSLLSERFG
ncbi:Zinc finger SWIM domain-containing protein [Fasciola gigantica]|uniref:Zinc finger SWIM domain-containing protein n=1 Tax=Fasciola gigantica TaxID=46835 RepID=A0A504YYB4_FASGI|nr:Zinc finger SWIM domain-containing protein [Fasciola gigantica]